MYHPEKLPSLHEAIIFRHFTLLEQNLRLELALDLVFESKEQLLVKRLKLSTVGELLKSGPLFPDFLDPLERFLGAAIRTSNSTVDANRPVREASGVGHGGKLDVLGFLRLHVPSSSGLRELRDEHLGRDGGLHPTCGSWPHDPRLSHWDRLRTGDRPRCIIVGVVPRTRRRTSVRFGQGRRESTIRPFLSR
jgi:hypothetical protein